MNGIQAIKASLESTKGLIDWFVADFSDADLLVRPVPGANHAAWQIGNVIGGDIFLLRSELPDAKYPELPAGFAERHGEKGAKLDGPDGFLKKNEYLKMLAEVRGCTIAALEKLTDADLDRPTSGKMTKIAPTLGRLFLLISDHATMHAGQFSVIRRKLGKPVLF